MGKPNFILIGETKCGTTSMFNYLIQHPQVLDTFGNGEGYDKSYSTKEIRFFDKFYHKGWEWYQSCFPECKENEVTGEATPMYMYRTQAARRIQKLLPDIKLIVLLRNPIDRLISNFYHNAKWVPGWNDQYKDFETFFNSAQDRDYYQIEKSIYYYSLKKWFEHFHKDQFCIVKSEDMYERPEEVYFKITRFLGLEDYSLSEYSVFRSNEYPNIDMTLRESLEDFYRPYNKKLEMLTGMEFNWF